MWGEGVGKKKKKRTRNARKTKGSKKEFCKAKYSCKGERYYSTTKKMKTIPQAEKSP